MILFKLVLGVGMIAATVAVHALFMEAALRFMRVPARRARLRRRPTLAVIGVVLWFFLAICVRNEFDKEGWGDNHCGNGNQNNSGIERLTDHANPQSNRRSGDDQG